MPPPIPSRPLGVRLISTRSPSIIVEIFQDLCCPFSKKVCATISSDGGVLDQIRADASLSSSVEVVFHNLPQPWHPQSPVMHEAMFAVSLAVDHDHSAVHRYIRAQYERFDSFTDLKMQGASRTDIHSLCADVAADALGDGEQLGGRDSFRAKVLSHLDMSHLNPDEPHMALGEVTKLLKFAVKHHRIRGVHVTPTVFINGIEAVDVSSSWTAEQWIDKLRTTHAGTA